MVLKISYWASVMAGLNSDCEARAMACLSLYSNLNRRYVLDYAMSRYIFGGCRTFYYYRYLIGDENVLIERPPIVGVVI